MMPFSSLPHRPAVPVAVFWLLLPVLVAPLLAQPVSARPPAGSGVSLAQRVDSSIDWGTDYLLHQVVGSEGWDPTPEYPMGYTAIQLYALLKNDISYLDPRIQEGLARLGDLPPRKVYSVSLAIMALDALLEQMEEDRRERGGGTLRFLEELPEGSGDFFTEARALQKMREHLAWLLSARMKRRAVWSYELPGAVATAEGAAYDHSNTQFAILALGVAERRKLRLPRGIWNEIAEHFVFAQEAEGEEFDVRPRFRSPSQETGKSSKLRGSSTKRSRTERVSPFASIYDEEVPVARGWGYTEYKPDTVTTFSMTCAAQSCNLLAFQFGRFSGSRRRDLEKSIRDGHAWISRYLAEHERLQPVPYTLYSLEKVGDIGHVKSYGDIDWYERGADILLKTQGRAGNWGVPGSADSRHYTALSLLYLGRASGFEPRSLVRITGTSAEARDFSQRYWVQVPSLEGVVPVIRYFRQLRTRPYPDLVASVPELLENYDPTHLDELVSFIRTLRHSPFAKIRELERPLLARLTGEEHEDLLGYEDWARQWKEVNTILQKRQVARIPRLLELLTSVPGEKLKIHVIRALQQFRRPETVEALIAQLASGSAEVRGAAHAAIQITTGELVEFDLEASGESREEQVIRVRQWWAERALEGDR